MQEAYDRCLPGWDVPGDGRLRRHRQLRLLHGNEDSGRVLLGRARIGKTILIAAAAVEIKKVIRMKFGNFYVLLSKEGRKPFALLVVDISKINRRISFLGKHFVQLEIAISRPLSSL